MSSLSPDFHEHAQPSARQSIRARTTPAQPGRRPVFWPGRCPTPEEWKAVQEHFKKCPEDRIPRGEQHPDGGNLYFLAYCRGVKGGERWGTKQQLVDLRESICRSNKAHRKHRRKWSPEFRAAEAEKFARLKAMHPDRKGLTEEQLKKRENRRRAKKAQARWRKQQQQRQQRQQGKRAA